MLDKMNLDLDNFLTLTSIDAVEFISRHIGFNIENIESMANLLSEICFGSDNKQAKAYLEKALLLYKICELKDITYSIELNSHILRIKQNAKSESKLKR